MTTRRTRPSSITIPISIPASSRRRPRVAVLAALVVCALAAACTPAEVNAWLIAHGKAPLTEPALSRVAAQVTEALAEQARKDAFVAKLETVSAARLGLTWRPGCPVGPDDLRLLTLSYWGDDAQGHVGEIIVHHSIALQTVSVFRELWWAKFPIHQMRTAEQFVDASDFAPDGTLIDKNEPDFDNNTSSFFCRPATGNTTWSQHAFGLAIDVNPLVNPYVKGSVIVPPNGIPARDWGLAGTIARDSVAVAAFRRAGFRWGGDWTSLKDWMHFSTNGH